MNNKTKKLILLFSIILIFIIFVYLFEPPCLFKKIFNIPCPVCGLTRSFKLIMHLQILESFEYNILGIPLFILLILGLAIMIKDIICKTNSIEQIYIKIASKYYIVIIILLLSFIINIIRNI